MEIAFFDVIAPPFYTFYHKLIFIVNISHCLIKNLTEKRACLKIKILPTYAYPEEGPEGIMGFTMKEKQTLTREYAPQYRQADRKRKSSIQDEYSRLTGYHRKYARARWGKTMLMLVDGKPVKLKPGTAKRRKGGGRKPRYGPEVIVSLRTIWAFFGYRCGKMLAPLIREQMTFFEAWSPFRITVNIKDKLLTISPRTRFRRGDHRPGLER
jgi:hypothetical protein